MSQPASLRTSLPRGTGLDRTYISGIENGRRNPTVIVLNDLAIQLGVDPRELLNPDVVER